MANNDVSEQLPIGRLLFLMVATFGLYLFGWLFKNNAFLNRYNQENPDEIWFFIPIANFFAMHKQFSSLKRFLEGKKIKVNWSVGWIIFFLIVAALLQGNFNKIHTVTHLVFVGALSILWALPLINMQKSLNEFFCKAEKTVASWLDFTNGQIVWFICGALFWILVIIIQL